MGMLTRSRCPSPPIGSGLGVQNPANIRILREVPLALVQVFDLLEGARVQDRIEHRLRLGARPRTARRRHAAGDLRRIHGPGIRAGGRIGNDCVAQLLQDALAELPGGELLVAGEHHLLDAHRPVLVDAEDELHRAVARHDLPFGDARAQEPLADVEPAQPGGHLLRHLRIDRLVLAHRWRGETQLRDQQPVRKRPVAAHVEPHHRSGAHRHDHTGAGGRNVLEQRRLDHRAQPAGAPVPVAHPAHALVERGQVEHVSGLQLERGEQLVAIQRELPGEPHLGDAGDRSFVDAHLERHAVLGGRPHGSDRGAPVPDAVVRCPDRLCRARDQILLELGVHLEIGGLVQQALRQRLLPAEDDRHELLHGREDEHQADRARPAGLVALLGERLDVRGHPREARAAVDRPHRVAHVARVQRGSVLQRDQRAQVLDFGPLEDDLAHPDGLAALRLRPRRQGLVTDAGLRGHRQQGERQEEELHSPSHLSFRSTPKSVPVVMCSLSSWIWPESDSESW